MANAKRNYKDNTFCALFSEKKNLVFSRDIYSRKLVRIPTPELYVFYNGTQDAPVEQEMKLSDAFMAECDKIAIEVAVKFINVNYEKGAEILKRCKAMEGYSLLLHMIREECEATGELKTAIENCIRKCVEEGIIADFLKEHGGEVMSFLFEKLTREECEAIREADGFEEGYAKGIEKGEAAGFEKGEASGFAKGKTEGYEEGEAAGELKVAGAMKAKGMTTNEICEITGLKPEQAEEL